MPAAAKSASAAPVPPMRKLRKQTKEWLRLAEKVYHYRRDLLSEQELAELRALMDRQRELLAIEGTFPEKYVEANDEAEALLKRTGGQFHPKSFWTDHTEMLVVTIILLLALRTFFFQTFKIPTNSMYPTYNGLTWEVYEAGEAPGMVGQSLRKVIRGADHISVEAPGDGELMLPLFASGERRPVNSLIRARPATGRSFFIFPSPAKRYTLYVGDRSVEVQVPIDFNFEEVMRERVAPEQRNVRAWLAQLQQQGDIVATARGPLVRTGIMLERGDPVISFDILSGDMLLVDRFTYHWMRPSIGDPFVFRTRNIDGLTAANNGIPDDKYYIKRLVGEGGDVLRIDEPVLYRNGAPIEGVKPFAWNHAQEPPYEGYEATGMFANGREVTIPPDSFYAMGDNSDESLDSRAWGFVPDTSVVGRAIFVYYPFSANWGLRLY